jgi:two-component system chemotaxis sensor kinase CheA
LQSVDHLFALIKDESLNDSENQERQTTLIEWCDNFLKSSKNKGTYTLSPKTTDAYSKTTYNVILNTHESVVDRRINVFYAIKDLSDIGEIKALNPLPVENTEEERWSIFVVGNFTHEDLEEALMFVYEYCIIRKIADFDIFNQSELDSNAIIEAHFNESTIAPASEENLKAPLPGNNHQTTINSIKQNFNRVSVDAEKIDYLMYLVSELITTSSQLNLSAASSKFVELRPHIEKLDKLSKQFRNNALNIRLIPIKDIIPKFSRMVRDLSNNLDKKVEFITEGMDTELDKSSIDLIAEPLVHLIRNALDHGIETPEERLAQGKTETGKITLAACTSGNDIFIEVKDDGKGLDKDEIIQKAKQQGLIKSSEHLSNKEIFSLIYQSGVSTAKEVTAISGRGVGMEIVNKKVAEMRGELDIKSEKGKGTSFTIKLQQSLSILDTLLVQSHDMKFLIPLSDVEVCSQNLYDTIDIRERQGTLDFEEELIPFVSLRQLFELNGPKDRMAKLIIIKKNNTRYALVTDKIIGQHQAVLKPMGELVKDHEEISAASILGNGEVAFLLDTNFFHHNLMLS